MLLTCFVIGRHDVSDVHSGLDRHGQELAVGVVHDGPGGVGVEVEYCHGLLNNLTIG